jgi:REP element-mobilizing transposase RayT
MGRRPRHDQPGWYYHVTARGNNREQIRWDDIDCGIWERTLARVVRRFEWEVLSFCLMPNHFHQVVHIPAGGLSGGMQMLNGSYALQVNRRRGRRDHVFGRRFWSKPISTRAYLLASLHYVAWNPVRGHLCESPEDFRWCSHTAVAGRREVPSFLALDTLLELFDPDPLRARAAYFGLVANGHVPVPGTVT